MRHLLEIDDLNPDGFAPGEFARVLELAADPGPEPVLAASGARRGVPGPAKGEAARIVLDAALSLIAPRWSGSGECP